ncbi:MAG: hypothetical protein H3C31_04670 [Brumimicrobium sp.]|nr:hypothetical protein [Brumimicrobium sp.]
MGKWRKNSIFIIIFLIALYFLTFPFNSWFGEIMMRHQIIQLPLSIILGLTFGFWFRTLKSPNPSVSISFLIVSTLTMIFWMIPRSIDMAVVFPYFNYLMVFSLVLVGSLIVFAFRNVFIEVKIAFLGMSTAMYFASGVTLKALDVLLCSSFDIDQQHTTGGYLLLIGVLLFIFTIVMLLRFLEQSGKSKFTQKEENLTED